MLLDALCHPSLLERLNREAVTRLFVSYEAVAPLNAERLEHLKFLFGLPGVLPTLIGACSLDELRAALPCEGVLFAARHGGEFHEPDEEPDRLENHLRLERRDPPALRRALTGWALANRSPSDAFAAYIGCAEIDGLAMQLIEQSGGWALFSGKDCVSIGGEKLWQQALRPAAL